MRPVDLQSLALVAAQLDRLHSGYAFTGGAVVGFLLDHPQVLDLRPTDDVDAITTAVSYAQQAMLEEALRGLGFVHDSSEGAPACRFLYEGVVVDVMPCRDETGRFDNPWFAPALATASFRTLEGVTVRTVDAPSFVATKLSAFESRGKGDVFLSHDLEDVITVVDGRESLMEEIACAETDMKAFIRSSLEKLWRMERFRDSLPGHLPPDAANQARLPGLVKKLEAILSL
jgi:hypothetical protein